MGGRMMMKDYHMHPMATQAPERLWEFAETAVMQGIKEICVTDHMPLSFIPDGTDRIPHGRVPEYIRRVRDFAKENEGKLSVKCGIEIDYHPSVLSEIEAVLSAGDFDYVIGSTHIHVFEDLTKYTFNDIAAISLENEIRAVETGWFHVVPHMEMYRFLFAYPHRFPLKDDGFDLMRHEALIRELLRKAKERDMYIEINTNLARQINNDLSFAYPQATVMEWAREAGVRFSYGSDAHLPHQVGSLLTALRESPVYRDAIAEWERE